PAGEGIQVVDVGYPIPHCRLRICDDRDQVLPEDRVGHVQIRGNNVTAGYYNEPAVPGELFTGDGWLRTGDVGFLRRGRLVVVGREKDVIIINGQNYHAHDIERTAAAVEGIKPGTVVCCRVQDHHLGTERMALFVLFKGEVENFIPLLLRLRARIFQTYGLEADPVIPVRKIPKTTSGKTQRFRLVDKLRAGEYEAVRQHIERLTEKPREPSPPHADFDDQLLAICRQVLKKEHLTRHDNLLETGLNSLTAGQLANRISQQLGTELPVGHLFGYPTIAALSQYLQRQQTGPVAAAATQPGIPAGALSYSQERFLLLDRYKNQGSAYNIVLAYLLRGNVALDALQSAFNEIIQRHETLRSGYSIVKGKPVQQVLPAGRLEIPCIDLSEEKDKYAKLKKAGEQEANRVFDLSQPPLLSVKLFRLGPAEFGLVIVTHHIVADGWSVKVLLEELAAYYRHYRQETTQPVPGPLPVQYPDYVSWQRNLAATGGLDEGKNYWLGDLDGELPVLDLGFGAPEPKLAGQGESARFAVPGKVREMLYALSKENQVTVFTTILTALFVLIHKYTEKRDIIISTDLANRGTEAFEKLIGNFSNTLPIRLRFEEGESFTGLLRLAKQKILGALNHQHYPFEVLLQELNQKNGKLPLFNVLVVFQNFRFAFDALGKDIAVKPFAEIAAEGSLVDVHFEILEQPEELSLLVRYNRLIFSAQRVSELVNHFYNVVQQAVLDAAGSVSRYEILSATEKEEILAFSHPADATPSAPYKSIVALFEANAARWPDVTAVVSPAGALTYRQLNDTADQVAGYLAQQLDVNPGDRVGLMAARSEWALVSMLGILKAGAAFVPVDPQTPAVRTRFILRDSGARLVMCDQAAAPSLKGCPCPVLDAPALRRGLAEGAPLPPQDRHTGPSALAYVIYTSGTTGTPKGVMIEHGALADYVLTFAHYFQLSPADRVIQQSSLAFDTMIEEVFPALVVSGRCIVLPTGGTDIDHLLRSIEREKATVLSSVPAVLTKINAGAVGSLKTLRLLISGGDVLREQHIDQLLGKQWTLYNTYGPSESTVCVTFHPVRPPGNPAVIGKPLRNHAIHITDGNLKLVPVGVAGEIGISGKGLARGYLNQVELTREKFVESPFAPGTRLYRTGDLGRWLPGGEIEFLGRRDEQIKISGIRIEVAEIEKKLLDYKQIKEAKVVFKEVAGTAGVLIAFYASESKLRDKSLIHFLSKHLPHQMIPAHFVRVRHFPTGYSGKLDVPALKRIGEEKIRRPYLLAGNPVQRQLTEVWQTVLEKSPIGILDNFFELGGDSIKAIRIGTLMEQRGVVVTVKDIFTYQNIKLLSAGIGDTLKKTEKPLNLTEEQDCSYFQNWFFAAQMQHPNRFAQFVVLKSTQPLVATIVRKALERLCRTNASLKIRYNASQKKISFNHSGCRVTLKVYPPVAAESLERKLREVQKQTLEKISVTAGVPVCGALLRVKGGNDREPEENLLVIAAHQTALGVHAWNVFLSDLALTYKLLLEAGQLPVASVPDRNWVRQMETYKASPGYPQEAGFWQATLAQLPPAAPPAPGRRNNAGYETAGFAITREETVALAALAREKYKADPEVVLLTAFLRTMHQWTGDTSYPLEMWDYRRDFQEIAISQTIGALVAIFPAILTLKSTKIEDQI
ncbi:MAG: amino acid adenylation domain-containing protein, partial [Cytophagales bacterium]|nr:amino acid adenylation domain-containing protein [Cytophagales bacterium]